MFPVAKGFWGFLQTATVYIYNAALTLGGPGLFLIALADSSFLSVPEGNDILIVVLSTGGSWGTMSYYVLMTVLGSVSGCSLLYLVGRRGGNYLQKRLKKEKLAQMHEMYRRWGVWSILVPSILPPPTPFKVFVLSAGVFRVSFQRFFAAILVGRSIRYFTWGVLALLYGEWAKEFLEEHLNTVGLFLAILFLGGILIYLFFWLRARRKKPQQGVA